MSLEKLEAEVLALPKDSQAELLARLLEHLGKTSEIEQEVSSIWIEEAEGRNQAMDKGQASSMPAEEVYCKRVKSKLYVGWVERQRNPTLSMVLLGFVPQPSLQATSF